MIELLFLPLLACLALVFIHVSFGAFVLRRGILFIDLALAQWAALGYLVGHWLEIASPYGLMAMGFGFTIIASLILTLLKPIYTKTNMQEAVIGVMYILGTTIATGLISSTGMEAHHLKDMLAGHILFIQTPELITGYGIYAITAGILWLGHTHFLHTRHRVWDFLFYVLFGAVVTSSVKIAGILLVFSYLVLPLLSTTLYTNSFSRQIKWGWGLGILASISGLWLSMILDIPPSYCVILMLCTSWAVSIGFNRLNTLRK